MGRWRWAAAAVLVAAATAAAWAGPYVPDDPYYATRQGYLTLIGMEAAWGYSLGRGDVIVAILDTGVMAATPDLAGRLLAPLSATGSPPLDGTAHHHGTWVASVAGMTVGNGLGGAGVGNFSLLPVTVTDAQGHNASNWIATGIRMAADAGARAINVSHSTLTYGPLNEAAAYARTRGALVFVAAGNTNRRSAMTGYDHLVFVSGTDAGDARWDGGIYGSTWGPYVDLSAPADDILCADPTLSTGYGLVDGTSFAAPLVAGAAALAWSINPALTPEEVLAMLYATAVDLGSPGWDEVFGHGRLNVAGVAAAAWASVPEPATLGLALFGLLAVGLRRRGRRTYAARI